MPLSASDEVLDKECQLEVTRLPSEKDQASSSQRPIYDLLRNTCPDAVRLTKILLDYRQA